MSNIGCLLAADKDRRAETESLLGAVCNQDRSWLYAHPEYELSQLETATLENHLRRLNDGEPVAYILGYKDFYNQRFKVSSSVLIPRPETEIIIDQALLFAKLQPAASFFDIGTGSGAIIISIASSISGSYQFFAGDISPEALDVAKENAEGISSVITFKLGSVFTPFRQELQSSTSIFIAANLPYLTPEERMAEKSIAPEPSIALLGGVDGLDIYRRLLKDCEGINGKPFQLMMEISPWQEDLLVGLAAKSLPGAKIITVPDLSGRTRFILVTNI
ncbi:MAG: N5-glutamine methyltransferase family protein [Bacillota bacterium]